MKVSAFWMENEVVGRFFAQSNILRKPLVTDVYKM